MEVVNCREWSQQWHLRDSSHSTPLSMAPPFVSSVQASIGTFYASTLSEKYRQCADRVMGDQMLLIFLDT